MYTKETDYNKILYTLNRLAKENSTCNKAQVGARIVTVTGLTIATGYNITMPDSCKEKGCHRMLVYGENSCEHRLPSDCYALHAEISAIANSACVSSKPLWYKIMVVTRYPCEACARAIVAAGIKKVVYSGVEEISDQTQQIFKNGGVEVVYIRHDFSEDNDEY